MTKFAYLKEFLIPHVPKSVHDLPLTSDGYARVKSIILGKFGKPVIVANIHIKCITSLSIIESSHPSPIHDIYEKLSVSVHALDTMKKVWEINGYLRIITGNLPGIRADIVRLGDDWQQWWFEQSFEVLKCFISVPERVLKQDDLYQTEI